MSQINAGRFPWACRLALMVGGWLAPSRLRVEWRARWRHGVENWWALVQRGEVTTRGTGELCRGMLADALRRRLRPAEWREWVRGPAAVVVGVFAVAAALVTLSGGLRVTRELWDAAMGPAFRAHGYDPRSDRLFGYMAPIVSALATGLFCAVVARLHVASGGWRYWSFLSFKLLAVVVVDRWCGLKAERGCGRFCPMRACG